ncbi:MAG TPA: helix-turn-helix domain-containing protein [Solirubrobacteraceae bacterium]|jgi:DNA-binding HxlR family transcriptional regulator|nr:helix-turn-helix domain-containing protein [Solirubrobacteraceae bacterium]
MPYRPFEDQNCSIAAALGVLGERWTMLVMREILLGRRRFAEIRDELAVAPNILSDRLDTLVAQGLLRRRRYGKHPDAHEYLPTRKGVDMNPVLVALMQWGDRYAAPSGPPRVYVHTACGHDARPELRCGQCSEELNPWELKVRPGAGANDEQRAQPLLPVEPVAAGSKSKMER